MAASYDPTDPRHLTPEQRLDELAAILAKGVRRLLALCAANPATPAPPPPEQIDRESEQNLLDVAADKSVHACRPVNATGEPRRI